LGSSLVAILTTFGIVASLLFETIHFFGLYPARDFFFSTVWNPQFRGGSDLGISRCFGARSTSPSLRFFWLCRSA
jgi:phosphate transport system permease protein